MAKKRPEFSFPELEHRGRNAILRSTAEVQAEEALLAQADAGGTTSESRDLPASVPKPVSGPIPAAETHTAPPTVAEALPKPQADAGGVSMRARTRPPKASPAAGVTERLRQKLRAKQH